MFFVRNLQYVISFVLIVFMFPENLSAQSHTGISYAQPTRERTKWNNPINGETINLPKGWHYYVLNAGNEWKFMEGNKEVFTLFFRRQYTGKIPFSYIHDNYTNSGHPKSKTMCAIKATYLTLYRISDETDKKIGISFQSPAFDKSIGAFYSESFPSHLSVDFIISDTKEQVPNDLICRIATSFQQINAPIKMSKPGMWLNPLSERFYKLPDEWNVEFNGISIFQNGVIQSYKIYNPDYTIMLYRYPEVIPLEVETQKALDLIDLPKKVHVNLPDKRYSGYEGTFSTDGDTPKINGIVQGIRSGNFRIVVKYWSPKGFPITNNIQEMVEKLIDNSKPHSEHFKTEPSPYD